MNFFTALLAQMPDAAAKGLIWGLMALGITIPESMQQYVK